MSYAAKSHDAIEPAERIRERLQSLSEEAELLHGKLRDAEAKVELELLLADLSSFLREVPTRNFSESQRLRCKGLQERVKKVRAG